MRYRVLNGIDADDLIKDWSKYCAAHGMTLGVPAAEGVQEVLIVAEGREARMFIQNPDGTSADETLDKYLGDYIRRHPADSVDDMADEEALRAACVDEDNVGFVVKP